MSQPKISEEKVKPRDVSSEEMELARLGRELEGLERRLGVWESLKLHRVAVLYGEPLLWNTPESGRLY
jgi:hypothetical protein